MSFSLIIANCFFIWLSRSNSLWLYSTISSNHFWDAYDGGNAFSL